MTALLVALLVAQTAGAPAKPASPVQQLFDAGEYEKVLDVVATAETPSPEDRYLAGHSALRLKPPDLDRARLLFGELGSGDEDGWTWVGRSAVHLAERRLEDAVSAAEHGVALAPELTLAHYQHGLALAALKRWAEAASAFEQAARLDPWFAYAHYHAGMANYQIKRIDKMVNFLEQFVKLAPQAPERPAVESLLRTLRR